MIFHFSKKSCHMRQEKNPGSFGNMSSPPPKKKLIWIRENKPNFLPNHLSSGMVRGQSDFSRIRW